MPYQEYFKNLDPNTPYQKKVSDVANLMDISGLTVRVEETAKQWDQVFRNGEIYDSTEKHDFYLDICRETCQFWVDVLNFKLNGEQNEL